jgi:hypothetical protein
MTLEEFKSLEVGDTYWLFMDYKSPAATFKIIEKNVLSFVVKVSLTNSTKSHSFRQHDEFQLAEDACNVYALKEKIRKSTETEERALRTINENRRTLEEFKEKLKYNDLLNKYPEEFI